MTATVIVSEPTAPRVRLPVIVDGRTVRLHFNEPVSVERLRVHMASGTRVEGWLLSEDKTQLTLTLAADITQRDTCHLDGVTDLAQRPNSMPPQRLELEPLRWPGDPSGLVFLWQTRDSPNLVTDPETGETRTYSLTARGRATFNHRHAMLLRGGAFLADEEFNQRLLKRAQATNQLTLEATITPDHAESRGPARIVTFSTDNSSRNVTLGQEGQNLILRLRTPQTGRNAFNPEVTLCTLAIGVPNHIIVTYRPGRLVCYRNGEKVHDSDRINGGFDNWEPHRFLIGDEYGGERLWYGAVEGIALYNRFMDDDEARLNARHYIGSLDSPRQNARATVVAELLNTSQFPTLESISPYRDALVTYEYRVVEVARDSACGIKRNDTLRVVHWALLNGETMPARTFEKGSSQRLQLEPLADNPQLERLNVSDTLPDDFEAVLYYDVLRGPAAPEWTDKQGAP